MSDPAGHLIGRDFPDLRIAGEPHAAGRMDTPFDGDAHRKAMHASVGIPDYPVHNRSYPRLLFPRTRGVAALTHVLALARWQGVGILARPAHRGWRGFSRRRGVWRLSPAGMVALLTGQNGLFTAAPIAAGLAFARARQPAAAGLAWALLTAKPHPGVSVLPMLLLQRRVGVILWGGLFLANAIGASIAAYGLEPWRLFPTETAAQQREVAETWEGVLLNMMPTLFT